MNISSEKKILVSIIVAAYNAERYLERCLESIASQTLRNFEVLIIDDGSIDSTYDIADSYAQKDSRFRIIRKEKNAGLSAARETGIQNAQGVYTIHIDSDDWVDPDMLASMYSYAVEQDADMVICDVYASGPHGDRYEKQEPSALDHQTVFSLMLRPELHSSVWNKLIRRSCYSDVDFHFIPGMLMEDQYAILSLLAHPIKVAYLNKAFYHYNIQNEESLVAKGIPPVARLRPLELIAGQVDISPVQSAYDRAIFYIAYESLFASKEACPDYTGLFKKHLPSIRRATGFPLRSKLLVLLRIGHVKVPVASIKKWYRGHRPRKS